MIKDSRYEHIINWGFILLIIAGVALALFQYLSGRSLWLDEAMLASSILHRNYQGLLYPLDCKQVAPIGFLYAQKLAITLLGSHEQALRIFPVLCHLVTIPLYYLLLQNLTKHKMLALFATAIFTITWPLIRYSSEVKQYSSDVLACIAIFVLANSLNLKDKGSLLLYGLLGATLIWFSNTAIIILFVVGGLHLYEVIKQHRNYSIVISLGIWAFSFLIYYIYFIHGHPTRDFMLGYWGGRDAFLTASVFSTDFYLQLFTMLSKHINFWLKNYSAHLSNISIFMAIIMIIGIFGAVSQRNYRLLYFCIAPFIVHFTLAKLHLYAFHGRLALYLIPLFILLYAYGIFTLIRNIKFYVPVVSTIIIVISIIPFGRELFALPIEKEEIVDLIDVLKEKSQPDEVIYLHHGSKIAFNFYQDIGVFKSKNPIVWGNDHTKNLKRYHHQLSRLTGKAWLLFSRPNIKEEKYIVKYMIDNGGKTLHKQHFTDSSIYLIDTGKKSNKRYTYNKHSHCNSPLNRMPPGGI